MGHLLKLKCAHSPLNLRILSSKSVPFTLTTVQVPHLALTNTKRITMWAVGWKTGCSNPFHQHTLARLCRWYGFRINYAKTTLHWSPSSTLQQQRIKHLQIFILIARNSTDQWSVTGYSAALNSRGPTIRFFPVWYGTGQHRNLLKKCWTAH